MMSACLLSFAVAACQLPDAGGPPPESDAHHLSSFSSPPLFGTRGSSRWHVNAGIGVDVKTTDNAFGLVGLGLSHFLVDHLSIDAELNMLPIAQRGRDAIAGNFNVLFRWHFLPQQTWSVYFDGGAGLLYANERVPENGTRFNFTPQAGIGVSFDIGRDVRLLTGVRWQHISNGSLYDTNPGRDSVLAYVGLSVPF
jgi:hypothetical protein